MTIKIGIVTVLIMIILWICLPMDSFYSGDSGVKLIQVENIIRSGYSTVTLEYNGKDIDTDSEISPFQLKPNCFILNGKNYSVFPVSFPFISSFLFSAFKYHGLYIIPLISTIGVLFVVFRITKRYLSVNESVISMVVAVVATPVFFYSLTFSEHIPASFMVVLSLLIFLEGKKYGWLGGLTLGISIWLRSEIVILIPILFLSGIFTIKRKKQIALYSLVSIAPVMVLLIFNKLVYSEWLGHVTRNMRPSQDREISLIMAERSINLWRTLVGMNKPQLLSHNAAGWNNSLALIKSNTKLETLLIAILVGLLAYGICMRVRNRRSSRLRTGSSEGYSSTLIIMASTVVLFVVLYYLTTCWSDRSPLITVLKSGGILSYSPYLSIIVLIPLIKHETQKNLAEIKWLLTASVLFLFITAVSAPNDGGIRYGARYVLPIIPTLSICSFIVYNALKSRKMFRIVFVALILISILIEARGYQILYKKKEINRELTQALLDRPGERIAYQAWWMIFNSAPVTVSKKTHILRDTKYLARIIEGSRRAGEEYLTLVLTKTNIDTNHVLYRYFESQNIKITNQQHIVSTFDTFFNYTVVTLKL